MVYDISDYTSVLFFPHTVVCLGRIQRGRNIATNSAVFENRIVFVCVCVRACWLEPHGAS
jgi:hypothetical protein